MYEICGVTQCTAAVTFSAMNLEELTGAVASADDGQIARYHSMAIKGHFMNSADVLTAIIYARDMGEDPMLILGEDSPLMDAAREAIKPLAPPPSCDLRTRLDALGVAIADAGYTWTSAMRAAYEGR